MENYGNGNKSLNKWNLPLLFLLTRLKQAFVEYTNASPMQGSNSHDVAQYCFSMMTYTTLLSVPGSAVNIQSTTKKKYICSIVIMYVKRVLRAIMFYKQLLSILFIQQR